MIETIVPITNTRILTGEFEYVVPTSLEEAVGILAENPGHAKILAGGTDLLVKMKMENEHPGILVDIRRIPGLRYIQLDESGLRIGALVTHWQIERSSPLRRHYTALAEAASSIGGVQIRAMGTLGGNLGNASPAADTAPPLLVMGAGLRLLGPGGERVVPIEEFFVAPGVSALKPGEIIVEASAPLPEPDSGSGFTRLSRVASDLAKVSVAASIQRQGTRIARARIALGSVFKTPLRAHEAEVLLREQPFNEALARRAGEIASGEIAPISDLRSTESYRRSVSAVLVREALNLAWSRSLPEGA
jgi:CO/xanthine dehydrogenase FAD-binding subunit